MILRQCGCQLPCMHEHYHVDSPLRNPAPQDLTKYPTYALCLQPRHALRAKRQPSFLGSSIELTELLSTITDWLQGDAAFSRGLRVSKSNILAHNREVRFGCALSLVLTAWLVGSSVIVALQGN